MQFLLWLIVAWAMARMGIFWKDNFRRYFPRKEYEEEPHAKNFRQTSTRPKRHRAAEGEKFWITWED